jgi:hypothetical protein
MVILALALQVGAQQSTVPAGRAAISGRVIDRATKEPLGQVIVTLQTADGRARQIVAATDDGGRYHFEAIAAGAYRVTAMHPSTARISISRWCAAARSAGASRAASVNHSRAQR